MTEPRLPTMEEMKEIVEAETLYKVAHVEDEEPHFNFSSCFVGHRGRGIPTCYQQLEYVLGKVTTAPSGSSGIFCYPSERIEFAQSHASGIVGIVIEPPCVVLKVKPLGKFTDQGHPMSVYVVGVFKEEEEYIKPFKVGDKVKVKESVSKPKWGWDAVTHKDIGVVEGVRGDKLEVNFPVFCDGRYNWSALASEMEFAPELKEEWVDVTRECKLSFLHAFLGRAGGEYIDLCHKEVNIASFGLNGHRIAILMDNYKVEQVEENYLGTLSTFRILRRELK